MESVNDLESMLVETIVRQKGTEYPSLLAHLPLLRLESRVFTGVGSYSNFCYAEQIETLPFDALITSDKTLSIDGLRYPLAYILDIENGYIRFLEIVTNDNEEWDGQYKNFALY